MKVKFDYVSSVKDGYQYFEGTVKNRYFSARFGTHLLVVCHKGEETAFIEGDGWPTSEEKRKAILEEYLEWV